jgi:hypothetical protein
VAVPLVVPFALAHKLRRGPIAPGLRLPALCWLTHDGQQRPLIGRLITLE